MEEVWKDIYFVEDDIIWDYRGLYQVSNLGNVKSLGKGNTNASIEKVLKPIKDTKGYYQIQLYKNGKKKFFMIHQLVAHMFLSETYFNGAEVDHIDTNRTNNNVNNLRWVTHEENCNNTITRENYSKVRKCKPKSESKLIERWSKDGKLLDIKYQFEYVKDGFRASDISSCCSGRHKSHKGFIFKYHEELE